MKRFIICGASRAGKSLLARTIQKELNITHLCGDSLVYAFKENFPEIGISFDRTNYQHSSTLFKNFAKSLLESQNYHGIDYVFECDFLMPHQILEVTEHIGKTPIVFLGYTDADPQEKLNEIRKHDPKENWWTVEQSDEKLIKHINSKMRESLKLKEECEKLGIAYFDTGKDFNKTIQAAKLFLIS